MSLRLFKCIISLLVLQNTLAYALDSLKVEKKDGLFSARDHTVPVVTAKYVGWGENWTWAAPKVKQKGAAYSGEVRKLDIDFSASISQNKNQIIWTYDWNKKLDHPNAVGFGLEFNFQLESPSFKSKAQDPELLPDNKGWRWRMPDGETLEVKFSPALAKVYFERNQRNKIRALFFNAIAKGSEQITMTVSTTGNSAQTTVMATNQVDTDADVESWPKDVLSNSVSQVDLSFLNLTDKPAGKHGFVKAQGDSLRFEDGTPIKFWGTNIAASALFDSSDFSIKAQAKRIAQLGFNLVRIHHHDSRWVKKNIFKDQANNTEDLSPEAFKKLDWWIKCLKDEGVYVWLDLHVGRAFTSNDGIENFAELTEFYNKKNKARKDKNIAEAKGFNYYNESIQKQMQRFNEAYLTHVNAYTKLAFKDDPAVFAMLVTNENDLTRHFGNVVLPDKGVPEHNAIFSNDVDRFSQNNGIKDKKARRTWDLGEPKIYLSDVEHRFNEKMLTHLHKIGGKSLVATTNSWGKMGLYGLPSLTDGDLIDVHTYGQEDEFKYNPRYNPSFLAWIGAAQVTGKPLSVSEWNMETFPVIDRYTMPLYIASIASLQGWDALMLYAYSQASFDKKGKPSNGNWLSYSDPAIMGLMPAAALLYRQGHVAPAKQNYELRLNGDDFFYKNQDPVTSKTIRTLLETSRFSITMPEIKELPWLNESKKALERATTVSDPNKDFIPENQNFVQSDTGELKRDWEKGIHTINTGKSQIAGGQIGGETIGLDAVTFRMNTKNAVVAVQSLDGKDLKNSKHIFITAMARTLPGKNVNDAFHSEPVSGTIELSAPAGLDVSAVNGVNNREKPIKVDYGNGKYSIKLDEHNQSFWYVLHSR